MSTLIDHTSRKFLDQQTGYRCLLQFKTDDISLGDPTVENPSGQIITTVMNHGAPNHRREYAISRPHIRFNDAEAAVDCSHLTYLEPDLCDLQAVQDRLASAKLS